MNVFVKNMILAQLEVIETSIKGIRRAIIMSQSEGEDVVQRSVQKDQYHGDLLSQEEDDRLTDVMNNILKGDENE